jgi:hypothetical protein
LGCCFFGCDFEKSCYGKSTRPFHVIVVTFGKASLTCEWTPRVIDCIIFFLSPRERTTGGGEDKGAHRSCCLSSTPVEPRARATPARTRPGGATAGFSNGGACMWPPTMGFARVLPRSEKLCGIRCRWSSLVPRWVAELVCSLPQWDSLGRGQGSKDSWPPARAEGGARAGEEPRLVSARMSGTNRAAALEPRGWGSCAHHRPWELGGATGTASRGCLAGLGGGPQAMGGIATGEGREKKERNRMDRFVYNQWKVVIL